MFGIKKKNKKKKNNIYLLDQKCVCSAFIGSSHITDLLVLRLAEDRGRVEANLLLFGAHEAQTVPVHMDQVGMHARDQSGFHYGPVL